MRAFKHTFIVTIILFFSLKILAQQDPQFSHYMFVKDFYNPAYAGQEQSIAIKALSRQQWVKFPGAPKTNIFTVDAPINVLGIMSGLGLKIMSDQYGYVKDMIFGLQYAYKFQLMRGLMSIGLSTNLFSKEFNPQWKFPDKPEQIFTGKSRSMVIDFDLGFFYTKGNFWSGFSVTHVTAPKFVFVSENANDQEVGLVRHFYLLGGYNYSLTDNLQLMPSLLFKTDLSSYQFDINLMALYNKKIWAGVSYRNGESVIFFFGTSYFKDVKLGLSYDALLNSIGRASSGSFEVYIGYNFSIVPMGKVQHYYNVKTL
jgi:type IX secretion system PorP/SprF family membrane protein